MQSILMYHLTPRNFGVSPGAAHLDSFLRLITWVMDSTVAATKNGRPRMEHMMIRHATMKRSKW